MDGGALLALRPTDVPIPGMYTLRIVLLNARFERLDEMRASCDSRQGTVELMRDGISDLFHLVAEMREPEGRAAVEIASADGGRKDIFSDAPGSRIVMGSLIVKGGRIQFSD